MVDLKALWVGDKCRIISSGRIGLFQGINGKRARIKAEDKILLVTAANLELYTEPEAPPPNLFEDEDQSSPTDFHQFDNSIDLHISTLAPHLENELPIRILARQKDALVKFLDEAEHKGARILTIIHGKGSGVLKSEVIHELKGRSTVKIHFDVHDGGAMEVHMY